MYGSSAPVEASSALLAIAASGNKVYGTNAGRLHRMRCSNAVAASMKTYKLKSADDGAYPASRVQINGCDVSIHESNVLRANLMR